VRAFLLGAKSEGYADGVLDLAATPKPNGCLITDGKASAFINTLIEEVGFEKIPSLASGNRAMMIIEGKAGAYIRDTGGFSKWDTSGPQAVIEAYGGTMSKLPKFLANKQLESYTHLKTDKNLDFVPGTVGLTLSNTKDKAAFKKDEPVMVSDVSLLKEYACLSGLVCLSKPNMGRLDELQFKMLKVLATNPPTYT